MRRGGYPCNRGWRPFPGTDPRICGGHKGTKTEPGLDYLPGEGLGFGLGFALGTSFLAFECVILSKFAQLDEGELGCVLALECPDAGLEGPDFASHFRVLAPLMFISEVGAALTLTLSLWERGLAGRVLLSHSFPLTSTNSIALARPWLRALDNPFGMGYPLASLTVLTGLGLVRGSYKPNACYGIYVLSCWQRAGVSRSLPIL